MKKSFVVLCVTLTVMVLSLNSDLWAEEAAAGEEGFVSLWDESGLSPK